MTILHTGPDRVTRQYIVVHQVEAVKVETDENGRKQRVQTPFTSHFLVLPYREDMEIEELDLERMFSISYEAVLKENVQFFEAGRDDPRQETLYRLRHRRSSR